MRTLKFLLRKEFKQIFRNKSLLPMIFVMPIMQLLILPLAADYEVKNISISIVDHDLSSTSRRLISKISASGYFVLNDFGQSYDLAFEEIEKDHADLILEIPAHFERNLIKEKKEQLFIAVNAINGTKASLGGAYLSDIIQNYNQEIRLNWSLGNDGLKHINISAQNWFNKYLNYRFFMVPGILAILVTMVGAYMSSLNVVKEKEIGTIEQINVTPIKKHHFILGKLIPFWIIGMFIFSIGLFGVARLVYGIIPQGSLLLLYGILALYLIAMLGFGLLLSTFSETQQQAMSLAFFFMMIFLLMSGLFTPIESMPTWARAVAKLNPVTYFIEVLRMIVLKGSEFRHVQSQLLAILGFCVTFNGLAIYNYKKTS
ncbi:ABC transporter permease [Persicobacter diffluens]|uniref:ABC transporter permease n=1 Tax=Persicobacter diffluens TaxID=981 RepID=A0AAN4W148_9BACT|nr:ABC transporter permease [Persicobacter diffluens]